ncbi:MAG: DUF6504 family protein [Planctomycetota bacterium]|jgi:hypothetical protein
MPEPQFISEPLRPVGPPVDSPAMARGEPSLPAAFTWRSRTLEIARVLERRKESAPCRGGSGERYLRRHRFTLLTTEGQTLDVYFERQPRPGRDPKTRWFLYTLTESAESV